MCKHQAIVAFVGKCFLCPAPVAAPAVALPQTIGEAYDRIREAKAARSRKSFAWFVRYGWEHVESVTLEWGRHLDAMCLHIESILREWLRKKHDPSYVMRFRKMVMNVPPGTLKSMLLNVFAPAWMWLHAPEFKIACITSNPKAILRDAMKCRELITSPWYVTSFAIDWYIKSDQDALSNFGTSAGGERLGLGWTSNMTGNHSDAIFVDDPNDAEKVYSDVQRTSVNDRWDAAISNRVKDERHSILVGIMQRLHECDWSGHVLAQGGWLHFWLALEFEKTRKCATLIGWEDWRTVEGENLFPQRFTPAVVAEKKKNHGSIGFAGQYQQRPGAIEGNLFKRADWNWFRLHDGPIAERARPQGCHARPPRTVKLDDFDRIVITVDATFKSTDAGSRVSCLVIGSIKADRFVLDNITRAMTFLETIETIRKLRLRWPKATRVLVEDKANGPAIIDSLTKEISGIIPIEPEGGKVSRAFAVSPSVESGNVYLLDGAEWLEGETDFVGELAIFPTGAKDDQVDSFSQALTWMFQSSAAAYAAQLCEW